MPETATPDALARENDELREQLREAHELIDAVRTGAVDALAIQGPDGPRIFTLEGADQGYRNLIEQMNEGAALLSADGVILYGNACLAGQLGRPLEAVMGSALETAVPEDFRLYWQALVRKGWEGRSKGELPLQTQDGSLRPFSVSMNALAFNDAPALAVIVTDLSAQREIEVIQALVAEQNAVIARKNEELAAQEGARRLVEQAATEARRLLEGIPQIAWTSDPRGVNTYLNRRWFDYAGREAPAPPRPITSRIHPDDYAAAIARLQRSLATGEAMDAECRLRNAAGDYRWMLGRALPSRDAQGAIIQWIGTFTDIHEHKLALERIDQAQRDLQENNAQLTRTNVDLDNFIYTASHDLKAPITNIEGLLGALLSELPPAAWEGEQVRPLLDMMQDSVDRFKRTIEHLTEVTKLQKEYAQAPPAAPVSLARVIDDVRLDLAPLVRAAGGCLEVVTAGCPPVPVAEKNLRSVVFNLLSNALKYRDPARESHVRVEGRAVAGAVVLTVQDNGLGLDLTREPPLFAMFQRLHDHVEGSGIGLYMVKKIVENAGGRIEVQSQQGVGSTFTVYFRA